MRKLTLLFLATFFIVNVFGQTIPTDCIGYWPFNNNANDESGNGIDGELYNTIFTVDREENSNSALSFNGTNSFIELAYSSQFVIPNGAISCWIKTSNDSRNTVLCFGGTNSLARFSIEVGDGSTGYLTNELVTIVTGAASTATVNRIGYESTNRDELLDGTWHHIVVVAGAIYKLYIDGEEKLLTMGAGTNNGQFTDISGIDNFRIGSTNINSVGENVFFNGDIDDVRIYNRALTDEEIVDLATETPVVPGSDAWSAEGDNIFNSNSGNVGIGTENPTYQLSVKGTVGCGEVIIEDVSGWADFVFEDDYNLMSLKDLENYIKANKHLPEIPTTAEVEEKGISVGEMNAKLLQKVEELTLYTIQQQNLIEALVNRVEQLENK